MSQCGTESGLRSITINRQLPRTQATVCVGFIANEVFIQMPGFLDILTEQL
jgi:hypothetical protein